MNWLPIKDAPRDRRVLLWCPWQGAVCGKWDDDRYAKNPRPYWGTDREHTFGTRAVRADQPTHYAEIAPPGEADAGATP